MKNALAYQRKQEKYANKMVKEGINADLFGVADRQSPRGFLRDC